MYKNEHIFEFYLKNNNKKEKKENETLSEASKKVLACIVALGYDSENSEVCFNVEKVIHMIMFDNANYNMLLTKENIDNLLEELKENKTLEAQVANKCMNYETLDNESEIINRLYSNFKKLSETPRISHMLYLEPYYFYKGFENVLEHIYGTLLLALGIKSEYNYYLNYNKLYSTLLIHETDEIIIGDSPCEINTRSSELSDESREAISEILKELKKEKEYITQMIEYKRRSDITMEYASLINKLEYLLQTKIYEIKGMYTTDGIFDRVYEEDKNSYYLIPCLRSILEKTKKL